MESSHTNLTSQITMVKIEGYLEQKDYRELIQYFWSKRCNSVDRPTVEACEKVVDALKNLEDTIFNYKKNERSS